MLAHGTVRLDIGLIGEYLNGFDFIFTVFIAFTFAVTIILALGLFSDRDRRAYGVFARCRRDSCLTGCNRCENAAC